MNFKPRKANVAQSMGGYLWAVSSLVGEKMQVRCLTETHVEVIKPPLQVIHIGNGCEGYSPSIKIPAKSELTSQNDIAERTRLTITPAETTPAQTISSTGAAVVVKDKIELLTTPKQIKGYEKYLLKQKEKLQEDTKL